MLARPLQPSDPDAAALHQGAAYVELDRYRVVLVSGADARTWLHDLVTTDVASLRDLQARPSLLLTPTGRVRAFFHVIGMEANEVLLAQAPGQPHPVDALLAPYVLSSDVDLTPTALRLVAVPGREEPPGWARAARPSVLGGGFDLLADEPSLEAVRDGLAAEGLAPAPARAAEARRVALGRPAFPRDLDLDSLPAEAGWDVPPVTDRGKGCFLGQESVAKVANLGHPARVVLAVEADDPLEPGPVFDTSGREVGALTSADGPVGLARVRWEARAGPFATAGGRALRRRPGGG